MQLTDLTIALLALAPLARTAAADGGIEGHTRLHTPTLPAPLPEEGRFGTSVVHMGDIDGDGVGDLVAGVPGAFFDGYVVVLFMNADGTVKSEHRIYPCDVSLCPEDFGHAVARVGDLDGNGVNDLAVGGAEPDGVGSPDPTVWVVLLKPDGSPKSDATIVGWANSGFGRALAGLGDVNGDGVGDLAVGDPWDEDYQGSLEIHFLDSTGQSIGSQEIGEGTGGFGGSLSSGDSFAYALARVGDLDGDGITEIAVGAPASGNSGAVWILFLDSNGTVRSEVKLSDATPELSGAIPYGSYFGTGLAPLADFDGNGARDLLVSALSETSLDETVLWQLFLDSDGSVRSWLAHSESELGLADTDIEHFGAAVAAGDLDGDGFREMIVGAPYADGASQSPIGGDHGEVWIFFPEDVHPATGSTFNGCGSNPPNTLTTSSLPVLGSTMELVVHNPIGSQTPGMVQPVLGMSILPSAGGIFGCGPSIPGWNMDPAMPSGELLLAPPFVGGPILGPTWDGTPTVIELAIPHEPALLSWVFYVQGFLLDLSPGASKPVAMTSGLSIKVGS